MNILQQIFNDHFHILASSGITIRDTFLKMWKKCFIAAMPSMAMPCSAVSIAATLGLFPSDAKAVFVLLAAILIPFAVLLLCLLS